MKKQQGGAVLGFTSLIVLLALSGWGQATMYGVFELIDPAVLLAEINEETANTTNVLTINGYTSGQRVAANIIDNIYWTSITNAETLATTILGVNVQDGSTPFKANLPSKFAFLSLFMITTYQNPSSAIIGACTEPYGLTNCEVGILNANGNYQTMVTFPTSITLGGPWVRVNDTLFIAALGNGAEMNLIKISIDSWQAKPLQSYRNAIIVSMCYSTTTGILSLVSYSNDLRLVQFSPVDGRVLSSVEIGNEIDGAINVVDNSCAIDEDQELYYTVGKYQSFQWQLIGWNIANGTIGSQPSFTGNNPTSIAII